MTKKTNKPTDIGKIRNSQIITTWGPGSLVPLVNDSVLVAGLDAWPEAFSDEYSLSKYKVLHQQADWIKIETFDDHYTGWISEGQYDIISEQEINNLTNVCIVKSYPHLNARYL